MSIKPRYFDLIKNGFKTIEYRRKIPPIKALRAKIYLHVSSPISSILGWMTLKSITCTDVSNLWNMTCNEGALILDDYLQYFKGKTIGFALKIKDVFLLESPPELVGFYPPQFFCYVKANWKRELENIPSIPQ